MAKKYAELTIDYGAENMLNNLEKMKLFIHFLKENNAYENFIYNFKNRTKGKQEYFRRSRNLTLMAYISTTHILSYVSHSFDWYASPESDVFWRDISNKWSDEIKEIEKSQLPTR